MLTNPTVDTLYQLGLSGMATAFQDLEKQPEARSLQHGEWLAILLEREQTTRRQKPLAPSRLLRGRLVLYPGANQTRIKGNAV